jgi:hypothetical protein
MTRKINGTVSKPQNPTDSAVREAKKLWTRAIETDAHARKCRPCNKRRYPLALAVATGTLASIDPYTPCRTARALWRSECAARLAFVAAGGRLA